MKGSKYRFTSNGPSSANRRLTLLLVPIIGILVAFTFWINLFCLLFSELVTSEVLAFNAKLLLTVFIWCVNSDEFAFNAKLLLTVFIWFVNSDEFAF